MFYVFVILPETPENIYIYILYCMYIIYCFFALPGPPLDPNPPLDPAPAHSPRIGSTSIHQFSSLPGRLAGPSSRAVWPDLAQRSLHCLV